MVVLELIYMVAPSKQLEQARLILQEQAEQELQVMKVFLFIMVGKFNQKAVISI